MSRNTELRAKIGAIAGQPVVSLKEFAAAQAEGAISGLDRGRAQRHLRTLDGTDRIETGSGRGVQPVDIATNMDPDKSRQRDARLAALDEGAKAAGLPAIVPAGETT